MNTAVRSALRIVIPALVLVLLTTPRYGFSQSDANTAPSALSVLGPHGAAGRGCGACHAAHSGSLDSGVSESSNLGLWGREATPDYGAKMLFGVPEKYVEVSPSHITSASEEVAGILLCLSCHDGNLTPQTMMPSQSYQSKIGLLSSPAWQPIPTLLSDYYFEHPLGPDATITLTAGLVFTNGIFSVTPGSPYARFVDNYGLPALARGKRSTPYGVNQAGQPYLLCTTCHNQHSAEVYPSSATSPIDGDGGGRSYRTIFYVNGPYNPKFDEVPSNRAASTTQFCRQCHFSSSNEGNNTYIVPTTLPNQ